MAWFIRHFSFGNPVLKWTKFSSNWMVSRLFEHIYTIPSVSRNCRRTADALFHKAVFTHSQNHLKSEIHSLDHGLLLETHWITIVSVTQKARAPTNGGFSLHSGELFNCSCCCFSVALDFYRVNSIWCTAPRCEIMHSYNIHAMPLHVTWNYICIHFYNIYWFT